MDELTAALKFAAGSTIRIPESFVIPSAAEAVKLHLRSRGTCFLLLAWQGKRRFLDSYPVDARSK